MLGIAHVSGEIMAITQPVPIRATATIRRRIASSLTVAAAASALILGAAGPAGAAAANACPTYSPTGFSTQVQKSYAVTSSTPVTDAAGNQARAWAGFMAPSAIVTAGSTTYVAYYDQNKVVTVASRTGSSPWKSISLGATLQGDSHNALTMAVDTNGNVHVAGNAHTQALQYWVTTTPGDIATLTRKSSMTTFGESGVLYESLASYARFFKGPGDKLFFRYRSGSATGAWTIVYQFNATTKSWEYYDSAGTSGLAKVFAGYNVIAPSPQRAAYPSDPIKGPDGNYHMVWTWRADGTAGTNSEVHYAYSADLRTWKNFRGDVIDAAAATATVAAHSKGQFVPGMTETMVDPVPLHGGLMNDSGIALGFDNAGKVVISYFKYVGSGATATTQLFTARPVGAGSTASMQVTQVSQWTGLYDLENNPDSNLTANVGAYTDGQYTAIDYVCQGVAHRLYLDPNTRNRAADIVAPGTAAQPAAIQASAFSSSLGYSITTRLAVSQTGPTTFTLLKWEAGKYINNGDLSAANLGSYPTQGSPLTLFTETLQ